MLATYPMALRLCMLLVVLGFEKTTACLVMNPITVDSYGFLFNSTTVGQASDSMTLAQSFYPLVGRFSLAHEPFSLYHHNVLI